MHLLQKLNNPKLAYIYLLATVFLFMIPFRFGIVDSMVVFSGFIFLTMFSSMMAFRDSLSIKEIILFGGLLLFVICILFIKGHAYVLLAYMFFALPIVAYHSKKAIKQMIYSAVGLFFAFIFFAITISPYRLTRVSNAIRKGLFNNVEIYGTLTIGFSSLVVFIFGYMLLNLANKYEDKFSKVFLQSFGVFIIVNQILFIVLPFRTMF